MVVRLQNQAPCPRATCLRSHIKNGSVLYSDLPPSNSRCSLLYGQRTSIMLAFKIRLDGKIPKHKNNNQHGNPHLLSVKKARISIWEAE